MKANRVREELKITIEYIPSGYYDTDEDWKLTVKFNDGNTHTLVPSGSRVEDLTINEFLQDIKDAIKEKLQ